MKHWTLWFFGACALLTLAVWLGSLAVERARQCPPGTVYLVKFGRCMEVPW